MSREIVTGIDVGTYHTKVIISEVNQNDKYPRIISAGFAKTKGMKNGFVMNHTDIAKTIKLAINQAQQSSGVEIKNAYISFGGIGLESFYASGKIIIGRVDSETTDEDLEMLVKNARRSINTKLKNKRIIHTIPLRYTLDSEEVLGSPIGMKGSKLEGDILFITAKEPQLSDLINTIESLDIAVDDVIASPIASSIVTLNKTQKMAGVGLVNIGAETTSIAVFEDNVPISVHIIPSGSADITNDLALEFKISLVEAEQLKFGVVSDTDYPKKRLDSTIQKSTKKILKQIDDHLKTIDKSGLLPAGIIFAGGGSSISGLEILSKSVLKLPTDIASLKIAPQQLKNSVWDVAYGLCVIGAENEKSARIFPQIPKIKKINFGWVKKFLP